MQLVGVAMVLLLSVGARAQQGTPADSGAAWVAGSLGYAYGTKGPYGTYYGTAGTAEAWLRPPGAFVVGAVVSAADQGYDRSTDVWSLLGGVRVPLARLRLSVAAGWAEARSPRVDLQNGSRVAYQAAVDWPVTQHVALHASRFALVGGQQPFVISAFGLAIGQVR